MSHARQLSFPNLRAAPSQVYGSVRLVPLCREHVPGDLRIGRIEYGDGPTAVALDDHGADYGLKYVSYIPHGLVIRHSKDGSDASFGTELGKAKGAETGVRLLHRMVKREDDRAGFGRLRLLPLHLAMEGFLAQHFKGPELLWREYSEHAVRRWLDPRVERSVRGAWLPGFEEALRIFEVHPSQVGTMVFVADALASVFVVSHPADYLRLHRSLVEDFFGELMFEYALSYPETPRAETELDASRVSTLADLRAEVARARRDWEAHAELLSSGLFQSEVTRERVRSLGNFSLERFLPRFDPNLECHIGEQIVRQDGSLEYMKTFRLSAAQVRRAYLLEKLAQAEWNLDGAAALFGSTREDFLKRLDHAGFGYLLKPHVLAALGSLRRSPR